MDFLILFLSRFSIICLKYYLEPTVLPKNISEKEWKIFLVSKFITQISEFNNHLFQDFILLVKGNMLANALLCPDLHSVKKNYENITFYLDTPLLLAVLKLKPKFKEEAVLELIELIKNLKGSLACFSHTVEELVESIRSSANYIDSSEGRGSIVMEARKNDQTKSDLILLSEKAEDILKSLDIVVKQTPNYKKYSLQIDEKDLENLLLEKINYTNPNAVKYDINSVRSIYVLRKNTTPRSIEKSKAILVTSNIVFAQTAYNYGKNKESSIEVSPVITDFSLANISWLKAPQGAPLLPQKEVMAYAYVALQPKDSFIKKVIEETDKLKAKGEINEKDHQLLRSNLSYNGLMNLTLGEDQELTGKSLKDTIKNISSEIKKEETEKFNQEKIKHKKTQDRLNALEQKNQRSINKLYFKTQKDATYICVLILFSLSIVYIFVLVYLHHFFIKNLIITVLMIIIPPLLSILDLFLNISIKNIYSKSKTFIFNYLFTKRKKELSFE